MIVRLFRGHGLLAMRMKSGIRFMSSGAASKSHLAHSRLFRRFAQTSALPRGSKSAISG
jgi:hypothetical protein